MRSSLSSNRALGRSGLILALATSAVAFGTGCPEDPPAVKNASLTVDVVDANLNVGEFSDVNITSRDKDGKGNTDAVTVTVEKGDADADLAGGIGLDDTAIGADPLSLPPDADGKVTFSVGCTGVGTLVLKVATDAVSKEKVEEVRCREANDFVFVIDVDETPECNRLQGDGVSACGVGIQVSRQFNDNTVEAANNVAVRVEAIEVTDPVILDGVRGLDPDGDLGVLTTNADVGALVDNLTLSTDDTGLATYFVKSSDFGLSEAVTVRMTIGNVDATSVFVFDAFQDQSDVTITADPLKLESGSTVNLTIKAKKTDGTAAAGRQVELTSPTAAQAVFTPAAGVVDVVDGVATVTLDANGQAIVVATAPTVVGRDVPVDIAASFDTGVNPDVVPVLKRQVTLEVSEQGSVVANAIFGTAEAQETLLKSDLDVPQVVPLTISATQSGAPFNGVSATATIASDSLALIRFSGAVGGTSPISRTVAALTDGEVAFDVVAASDIARGTARVEVEVFQGAVKIFDDVITIQVDREPILQSVTFEGAEPAVIGVRGGTLPSSTVVSFKLFDDTGAPLAGVPVSFVANATADRGVAVEAGDISGADGTVSTTLIAGSIAGPVTVVVTARPANGRAITVSSASIAIVGGLPNFLNSSFVCDTRSGALLASNCTANLVDRFTNRTGPAIQVQFRAEGGNIDPSIATDAEGAATAAFVSGNPGHPAADVPSWSYGRRVTQASDLAGFAGGAACTDATVSTPCNLIALCADADTDEFCPLPGKQSDPDLVSVTRSGNTFSVDASRRCDAELPGDARACGYPVGCLDGTGIECAMNPGCFDFSAATSCPQSGLVTLIASVRGEEAFLDGNGNGILDFVDLDADGRHEGSSEPIGVPCNVSRDPNCIANADVGALFCPAPLAAGDVNCRDGIRQVDDFIDTPEPFLDKNGNCARDNFLNARANGMSAIERQISSDLFSDVDGSLTYGFDPERDNIVTQTNGTWDADTEIFLETQLLEVDGVGFIFGEACAPGATHTCTESASGGGTSSCTEVAPGVGIAEDCTPQGNTLVKGDFGEYLYQWRDGNGNCPTTDFGAKTTIASEGLVTATGAERKLDAGICGFGESFDRDRPWCTTQAALGAPVLPVFIAVDCDNDVVDNDSKVVFELIDTELGAKNEVGIIVDQASCAP